MATNKTLTQLELPTLPVEDTDLLYLVRSGVSYKVTVADLSANSGGFKNQAWTASDQSGASLSLNTLSATESQNGNIVSFSLRVQYPTTSSTANASLNGLTLAADINTYFTGMTDDEIAVFGVLSGTGITLYDIQGIALTNQDLSGQVVRLSSSYQTPASNPFFNQSWTAADASSSGLSLTTVAATESQNGNMVTFSVNVLYPTNSNTNNAVFNGLTLAAAIDGYFIGDANGIAIFAKLSGTNISLYDIQNNAIKNSVLSGRNVKLSFTYQT